MNNEQNETTSDASSSMPLQNSATDDIAELRLLWQNSIHNDSVHLHPEAIIAHLSTLSLNNPHSDNSVEELTRNTGFYKPSERASFMTTLLAILQNRERFVKSILASNGESLRVMALALAAISGISFCIYGFVLGAQHSVLQGLSAAVKLPLLFLLTILITFPTLFIFGSLIGINRTFLQTAVILLSGTTIISLALVALSPVTLLFGMTTSSYAFFKLLNVGIFIVAWFLGAAFFRAIYAPAVAAGVRVVHRSAEDEEDITEASIDTTSGEHISRRLSDEEAENHTKIHTYFIRFWFLLYGFVAVQIAWMLRPFVCSSSMEFELLRGMRENVYGDILYSIAHILGFR